MRKSAGRTGPSRNGGHKHVHKEIPLATVPTSQPTIRSTPAVNLAPIVVRDAIYRELIRLSPANRYRRQLIDGPEGLLARGLARHKLSNFGALPATHAERARLARALRSFASARFPQHANLDGIPGFWRDSRDQSQIWKQHDYHMPMLLVPYKDGCGRIQACQLRLHSLDLGPDNKRYRWLASPNEPHGCSSGTPIHFSFLVDQLQPGADVVITEGGLKLEIVHSLRGVHLLATSGVSCSHGELIEAARSYNALIAFDADHKTNPHVCRQLARLIAARELDRKQRQLPYSTRILSWSGPKGIDDAVRQKTAITIITIQKWLNTLDDRSLLEVEETWREVNFCSC